MLSNIIIASAVLAGAPLAHAIGSAIVVNGCNYPVKLCNVPAANGGHEEYDTTLQPQGTYEQQWTELTNGDGWSIKLSPDDTLDHIMQYEYTFHNDGIIWYDLSEVDGNPWNGNFELTADGTCAPRQAAYRYSTDDAYGMQSCADSSTITVLLCSGESQNDGAAGSLSSSAAASATSTYVAPSSTSVAPSSTSDSSIVVVSTTPSAPAPVSTTPSSSAAAPTTSSSSEAAPSTTSTSTRHWRPHNKAASSSTTLATVASTTTSDGNVVIVTEVVTEYATATAYAKRHEHHAHPHFRA